LGADVIHLHGADGEMSRHTDINSAAKSHGKGIRAGKAGGDPSYDWNVYPRAQAGMCRAKQGVGEDGASAKSGRYRWAE